MLPLRVSRRLFISTGHLQVVGKRGLSSQSHPSHHITHLVHRSGSNVYLVGVRHDQKQSQADVRDVICSVKPQVKLYTYNILAPDCEHKNQLENTNTRLLY